MRLEIHKKFFIVAILVIIAISGFFLIRRFTFVARISTPMTERVFLTTTDGAAIIGDYSGKPSEPAVLMLHMMPATKESWRIFSEKLNTAGFQTLAIDLRGHGESEGGPQGYKRFSDAEHQASIHDAEAGIQFLKSKSPSKIFIAGASIGANLALQYAVEHPEVNGIVLLSPGLDYRGIKTEPLVGKLPKNQGVYFAASADDSYSADTVKKLFDMTPTGVKKELKMFERAGHGTTIFEKEPAFMDELVSWLLTTKESKDK